MYPVSGVCHCHGSSPPVGIRGVSVTLSAEVPGHLALSHSLPIKPELVAPPSPLFSDSCARYCYSASLYIHIYTLSHSH